MATAIETRLKAFEHLSPTELRKCWGQVFRSPAPKGASRDFLLRALTYKTQEDHFGGLRPSTQRRLRQMAKTLDRSPGTDLVPVPFAKPGTKLVRQWHNRKHEVTVLETGFAYDGKVYDSLSKVAREITGTRWSGPVFFGLCRPGTKAA